MSLLCPECSSLCALGDTQCSHCGKALAEETASTARLLCPSDAEIEALVAAAPNDETALQRLQQHISTCAVCRRRVADLRSGSEDHGDKNASRDRAAQIDNVRLPLAIGDYRILGQLGEGHFGVVYRAQKSDGTPVALKVLKTRNSSTNRPNETEAGGQHVLLFQKESASLDQLSHPNVVQVIDSGQTHDGRFFIASQLIEGPNLRTHITSRQIQIDDAIQIVALVARGLDHAHRQGIVHRDVKPENILLSKHGIPYVADFGLVLTDSEYGTLTAQGGTRAYMSPEQARGEGNLADNRSDIFSLGIVLYEMIAGERPFPNFEVLDNIQFLDPRPLHRKRLDVSPELNRICMKALEKQPSERYSTANELANDLLALGTLQHVRQVNQAANDWLENQRNRNYLVRGGRLRDWHKSGTRNPGLLFQLEIDFLGACQAEVSKRVRMNMLVGVFAFATLAASIGFVKGNFARKDQETATAESDAFNSRFRELVSNASDSVAVHKPHRAIKNALKACEMKTLTNQQQIEARNVLIEAISRIGGIPFGHHGEVTCMAPSHDGKWLLSGGGAEVRLWKAEEWTPDSPHHSVLLEANDSGPVRAVAINNDGRWLASGDENGVIRIWSRDLETSTVTPLGNSTPQGTQIDQLEFSGSAIIARSNKAVSRWSLRNDNPLDEKATLLHAGRALQFAVHPTEELVAVSSFPTTLSLVSDAGETTFLNPKLGTTHDMQFSKDGTWLAVMGQLGVWVVNQANLQKTTRISTERPKAISFDGDTVLFIADRAGTISRYVLNDVPCKGTTVLKIGTAITSMAIAGPADSRRILATSFPAADILDAESTPQFPNRLVRTSLLTSTNDSNEQLLDAPIDWSGHDQHLVDVAVAKRFAFTASHDGHIRRWDLERKSQSIYPLVLSGEAAAFNEDGKFVAASGSSGSSEDTNDKPSLLREWERNRLFSTSGFLDQPVPKLHKQEHDLAEQLFSIRNGWIAFFKSSGLITYLEFSKQGILSQNLIQTFRHDLRSIAVSADGTLFVRSVETEENNRETHIRAWTLRSIQSAIENGSKLRLKADYETTLPSGSPRDTLEVSPSGKHLATSGTNSEEVVVFSISQNGLKKLKSIKGIGRAEAVSFGQDDSSITIGCAEGMVSSYQLSNDDQFRELMHRHSVTAILAQPEREAAIGDFAGNVEIYDFDAPQQQAKLHSAFGSHAGPVRNIQSSPDGRFIISIGVDGETRVYMRMIDDLQELGRALLR